MKNVFRHSGVTREGEMTNCKVCDIIFTRRSKEPRGKNKQICCSKLCSDKYKARNRIKVSCFSCNKEIEKKPSQFEKLKSKIFFCSKDCKNGEQKIGGVIAPPHYGIGSVGKEVYWRIAEENYPVECKDCGMSFRALLVVHHKDGDKKNQNPENLEFLCPNHHALRHIRKENNKWKYDTKSITPLDMISSLQKIIFECSFSFESETSMPEKKATAIPNEKECAVCAAPLKRYKSRIKSSKSGIFCCSVFCKNKAQRGYGFNGIKGIEKLAHRFVNGNGNYYRKKEIFVCCEDCKVSHSAFLVVHHKDGDRSNNREENLEVLCHLHHGVRHLKLDKIDYINKIIK